MLQSEHFLAPFALIYMSQQRIWNPCHQASKADYTCWNAKPSFIAHILMSQHEIMFAWFPTIKPVFMQNNNVNQLHLVSNYHTVVMAKLKICYFHSAMYLGELWSGCIWIWFKTKNNTITALPVWRLNALHWFHTSFSSFFMEAFRFFPSHPVSCWKW